MKTLRRRTAWILILAVVLASIPVFSGAATEEFMKIGLRYGSSETTATLTSAGGFVTGRAGDDQITPDGTDLGDVTQVTLRLSGGKVLVTDSSGNQLAVLSGDGTECIAAADYASGGTLRFSGSAYRGGIIPYINPSGQMNIINYLSVDDYVRGVVHSEIGQSSHIEAIKAQAVAVRSYAVANKGTHSAQGFDMCATTHCQVYSGADSEYESTNRAVDETAGELIYYEGEPVVAYYFANSGGHTENSEDAWATALGYLRGIVDEYSPEYTWTVRLTRAELNNTFASRGLGTVESVTIDSVNESGYAASVTVNGSRDSVTYTKENIRSALGTSLRSRNFTFDTEGGILTGGGTAQPAGGTYYGLSSLGTGTLGQSVSVLSAGGVTVKSLDGMTALGSGGTTSVLSTASSGTSGGTMVMFDDDSDVLIINGKGYGHGVGMSQQGAQQMANLGFTYRQILQYYYTGIEVR